MQDIVGQNIVCLNFYKHFLYIIYKRIRKCEFESCNRVYTSNIRKMLKSNRSMQNVYSDDKIIRCVESDRIATFHFKMIGIPQLGKLVPLFLR